MSREELKYNTMAMEACDRGMKKIQEAKEKEDG